MNFHTFFWILIGLTIFVVAGGIVEVIVLAVRKRTTPIQGDYKLFLETLDAAIPLIQFAVANHDPSQNIWPYDKLKHFGQMLQKSHPDFFMRELGGNLIEFSSEFRSLRAMYEAERDAKKKREEKEATKKIEQAKAQEEVKKQLKEEVSKSDSTP